MESTLAHRGNPKQHLGDSSASRAVLRCLHCGYTAQDPANRPRVLVALFGGHRCDWSAGTVRAAGVAS